MTNNEGYTALMLASVNGRIEVLRLLLDAGADKNMADNDGDTAAMLASLRGHVDIVSLLEAVPRGS